MRDPDAPPSDPRIPALALAIVAALLMGYAAISHRWLENTNFRGKPGFSLLSFQVCDGDTCESRSNLALMAELREARVPEISGVFAPMGIATFALLIVGALALLASAALVQLGKRPVLPITPPTIAMLAILGMTITGLLFIVKKPGGVGGVGVGPGFFAYGVALVVGIIASQLIAKLIRPVDPDELALPPGA
jgi:hypothetical protein